MEKPINNSSKIKKKVSQDLIVLCCRCIVVSSIVNGSTGLIKSILIPDRNLSCLDKPIIINLVLEIRFIMSEINNRIVSFATLRVGVRECHQRNKQT